MNILPLYIKRDQIHNEYIHKSIENKKPIKLQKQYYLDLKRNDIIKLLQHEIEQCNHKIQKINTNNTILNEMIFKLMNYGYTETMARDYINKIDKIIDKLKIQNKLTNNETYFIIIVNKIKKDMSELLSLIYNDIKLYYNYRLNN
jgi:hypothetical protein